MSRVLRSSRPPPISTSPRGPWARRRGSVRCPSLGSSSTSASLRRTSRKSSPRAARASWPRWTAPGIRRQVVVFSDASASPLASGASVRPSGIPGSSVAMGSTSSNLASQATFPAGGHSTPSPSAHHSAWPRPGASHGHASWRFFAEQGPRRLEVRLAGQWELPEMLDDSPVARVPRIPWNLVQAASNRPERATPD